MIAEIDNNEQVYAEPSRLRHLGSLGISFRFLIGLAMARCFGWNAPFLAIREVHWSRILPVVLEFERMA
jgi:hypothetical protein